MGKNQSYDVIISYKNAHLMNVDTADEGIIEDLYYNFRYKDPSYFPRRGSTWDGMVRMYDKRYHTLPVGMIEELIKHIKKQNYSYIIDDRLTYNYNKEITLSEIEQFVDTLTITDEKANVIRPYDYQIQALHQLVKRGRYVAVAATSAGKSLIQYLVLRYWMEKGLDKLLFVVPSVMLVNQLFDDFVNYSQADDLIDIRKLAAKIYSNSNNTIDDDFKVTISTWQSLQNIEDKTYFAKFEGVSVDEVHGVKGAELEKIMKKCIHADDRIGLTGTLGNNETHELQVISNIGHAVRLVSAKELIEQGRATPLKIAMLNLRYNISDRNNLLDEKKSVPKNVGAAVKFQIETDFICKHSARNAYIVKLAKKVSLNKNTIILCSRREHIAILEILFKASKQNVHVITGDVVIQEREDIKKLLEESTGNILIGTTKCLSTGLSIKNLHNMVLASGGKSLITLVQSIGRLMRLHGSKEYATIFDLVDNLQAVGENPNFYLEHSYKRYSIWKDQGHPVATKSIDLVDYEIDEDKYKKVLQIAEKQVK